MKRGELRAALRLYAVTDRSWLAGRDLAGQVEEAIRGGVTFVQLREKALSKDAFLEEARRIQPICARLHVPFVVNDDVEIALRCGADGVHVGQEDMGAGEVRALLGPDRLLGVSAGTVAQALAAQEAGADYLGVGAVFSTSTKRDADGVSLETLGAICSAVSIPVVAIGGISAENVSRLAGSGIAGIAVVSALFAAPDIRAAAERLSDLTGEVAA